jgi:hypothetical protein
VVPGQQFCWTQTDIQKTNFEFVTNLEFIEEEKTVLKEIRELNQILGTLELHAFLAVRKCTL